MPLAYFVVLCFRLKRLQYDEEDEGGSRSTHQHIILSCQMKFFCFFVIVVMRWKKNPPKLRDYIFNLLYTVSLVLLFRTEPQRRPALTIYCYYSLFFTNKCSNYQIMSFHLNYTLVKVYSRTAICSHILHPHTPTRHIDFFYICIWLVNFGMALYYELLFPPHINGILTYCFLRNIVWSHFPLQQEATRCF